MTTFKDVMSYSDSPKRFQRRSAPKVGVEILRVHPFISRRKCSPLLSLCVAVIALTGLMFLVERKQKISSFDAGKASSLISSPRDQINMRTPTNRTLVVTLGSLRGGERAWHSMYKHVLDENHADLAITISNDALETTNSSMVHRARYVWAHVEYERWDDALDSIGGNGEWKPKLPGSVWQSGIINHYLRWFVSNQIRQLNLTEQYDRFVVTRTDQFYECAHHVLLFDPQFVWLPEGEDYLGGLEDRHLVASKDDIFKVLNTIEPVVRHPERYPSFTNPEQLLRFRFDEDSIRIKRFKRVMFLCAVPGDPTRWQHMEDGSVPEGVHVKYLTEYEKAKQTCSKVSRGRRVVLLVGLEGTGHHWVYETLHRAGALVHENSESAVIEKEHFVEKYIEWYDLQSGASRQHVSHVVHGADSFPENRVSNHIAGSHHPALHRFKAMNDSGIIDLRVIALERDPVDAVCSAMRRFGADPTESVRVALDSLALIQTHLRTLSHTKVCFKSALRHPLDELLPSLQQAMRGIVPLAQLRAAAAKAAGTPMHTGTPCASREYLEDAFANQRSEC